jgi:hypothetical protein
MIRLLAVTFLVLSAQVSAQNLHVFEDGQTIDAARFNENFTALKDAINSGGSPQDGAAYGSPVWVDSNGTVLTGRDGRNVIWRVNGELRDIGEVWNGVFVRRVKTYYYAQNCSGNIAGYEADSIGDLWITNGVLHEEGALLQNSPLYNSTIMPPFSCSNESGETEGRVHQESSIGVAAPSWATEGAQMLEDWR